MRDAGCILGEDAGRLPPYVFVDYSRIDSGLNQGGPYLGSLCGIDRIENWEHLSAEAKQARKTMWMERLVADLDREFPGLAKSVVHRELATAETMAAIIREDPAPLPDSLRGPLRWTIERCLAKEPARRYDATRDLFLTWCIGDVPLGDATKEFLVESAQAERKSAKGHLRNAVFYECLAEPMAAGQVVRDYWKEAKAVKLIRDELWQDTEDKDVEFK